MDPATIALLIGLGSLIIERTFKYMSKTRRSHFKSSCCNGGMVIERDISITNNINDKK